jgi:predicted RNase H-like HicB family nuclease
MTVMKKVKQKILNYTAVFREEPEGGYTVVVPSLQGCVTYGKTFEQAEEMAKEAIGLYLKSLAAEGEEAPVDETKSLLVTINVLAPKNLQLEYA